MHSLDVLKFMDNCSWLKAYDGSDIKEFNKGGFENNVWYFSPSFQNIAAITHRITLFARENSSADVIECSPYLNDMTIFFASM